MHGEKKAWSRASAVLFVRSASAAAGFTLIIGRAGELVEMTSWTREVWHFCTPSFLFVVLLLVAGAWATGAQDLTLPNRATSLKFAAFGDNGTGEGPEYDVGRQMAAYHGRFPFEMVIMLGDNLYGSHKPEDFVRKWKSASRMQTEQRQRSKRTQ